MKYCQKCIKEFETEESVCPVCGKNLVDIQNEENNEYEAAEIISTMMITDIL